MPYKGSTWQVPFSRGGFNGARNYDGIPSEAFVEPTRNINLHQAGRGRRGGTQKVNGTAVTSVNKVLGGYEFRLKNGTQFIVFLGDNGGLYKNYTTTIKTAMSTTAMPSFETFENELFVCDAQTSPQTWDGVAAGTSNITTPAADWSGANQPSFLIKHGRGNSERLWFSGVDSKEEVLYYSSNGNGKVVSGGTSGTIAIETKDGFGIVGCFEFGDRLFACGKRKIYQIEDTDATLANWGYDAVAWEGGVAHHWLIAKTPNDVILMMEDGEIYSATAVQSYGDYKAASLTRPSYVNNWIEDNVKLANINEFHMTYDPNLRAIKIFVMRNGQNQIDTALLYFIDRPIAEAWAIHSSDGTSGYKAATSFLVRKSASNYKIYTGGYTGFVWELEHSTLDDGGTAYSSRFRSAPDPFGQDRMTKKYRRGWLVFAPKGDYDVDVKWWIDGVQQTTQTVSTVGTGGVYGSALYGTAVYGGQEINEQSFNLRAVGKRFQYEIENAIAGEDFLLSKLMIDAEMIGPRGGR